ncbi:MAG: L-histidine N(alpha)-methyltransferase [Acidobacteriaceae bacterium]|nr:L-histidine N(alpha)-methyltransferase [Acidobacteriaceae bacterium]
MSAFARAQLTPFALDVAQGFALCGQRKLPPRWFYDDLGSALFEAITYLPEYGLTRADERLLREHASDLAFLTHPISAVAELGSGSGRKTRFVLQAASDGRRQLVYRPIDVSVSALSLCEKELGDISDVRPVREDWLHGLEQVARERNGGPLLLLFLGSSVGNIDRESIPDFLKSIRALLLPGDFFLLGADLVKDTATMISAYNDSLGVTAAFNLNILRRINQELGANFDLRAFEHDARWNARDRRIEMHLVCCREATVRVQALDTDFVFRAGETIWTESSHKFTGQELSDYARAAGFDPVTSWTDAEWPFVEALWRV